MSLLDEIRKRAKVYGGAEFWKPEKVGDEIYGEVVRIFTDQFGNERIQLRTPNGEYILPSNKALVDLANQIEPGIYIYVRYEGERKIPGRPQPMKLFAVTWLEEEEAKELGL